MTGILKRTKSNTAPHVGQRYDIAGDIVHIFVTLTTAVIADWRKEILDVYVPLFWGKFSAIFTSQGDNATYCRGLSSPFYKYLIMICFHNFSYQL